MPINVQNPRGVKESYTSSLLVFFTLNHFDFQLLTSLLSFLAKKKEAKKVVFFAKTNSRRQQSCRHFKQVFAISYPFRDGCLCLFGTRYDAKGTKGYT
jgi:hypothetical protein